MDAALVLALLAHTIGLVIAWGHYGILGRITLPALERSLDRRAQVTALIEIERRAAPLVLLSGALFVASGTYLLVANANYAGLGNVFASTWTTLMLVKHVLVVGFVALAVVVDRLIRRLDSSNRADPGSLRPVRLATEAATGLGAVIVLLTAAAQVAA